MSTKWKQLNSYDLHKALINEYLLKKKGDTELLKERDSSKDKRDHDVIRENHQFLWEETEEINTWERQLAKKYYNKLFKEYCICDLSNYKESKVAMRWRTEQELIDGKGQFICGDKMCVLKEELKTWEVNFAYVELGVKKNALIKLRLCSRHSRRLNYHSNKKEVKRAKMKTKISTCSQFSHKDTKKKDRTSSTEGTHNTPSSSKHVELCSKTSSSNTSSCELPEYINNLFL